MSIPANLIDPTVAGNYPVILSDALMGTTAKEIFTGVRYNHKPTNSENSGQGKLKPSIPGNHSSYDLSYTDNTGDYGYSGSRTVDDGQYVLYFSPARKAFVLDRVDSTFHMNLKSTPTETAETLEKKHPPLGSSNCADKPTTKERTKAAGTKAASAKASTKKAASKPVKEPKRKAPTKKGKAAAAAAPLVLPTAAPEAPPKKVEELPKPKRPSNEFEDDDDDDDDGGLTVEYPDADKRAPPTTLGAPTFLSTNFSDFVKRQAEHQDEDIYSDGDDEGLFDPSEDEGDGAQNKTSQPFLTETMDIDEEYEEEEEEDNDMDMSATAGAPADDDQTGFFDLEAEFEREMAAEREEKQQSAVSEEESDVSEAE
ncbi:hypothetical protein CFIMG_003190RA [Ceratocystis fimbriata CBS 114723]|uniref:Transcription elongation factor Eaf N-terminal domain-containing protein n=1 Tax=Ceratocystis fimbriata CBS 114723 TaxID=1035309 RepID=A0A2C5X9V6_9PEZI|nr:hypothetical protein CFIMG_003190RA [Ceratocystis fimbriata CBS 114723]